MTTPLFQGRPVQVPICYYLKMFSCVLCSHITDMPYCPELVLNRRILNPNKERLTIVY